MPLSKSKSSRKAAKIKLKIANDAAFLTCGEIARLHDVHPDVPRRWIMDGRRLRDGTLVRLEALRIPGQWRIRPEALERFLQILAADQIKPHRPAAKPGRSAHDAAVDAALIEAGFSQ